MTGADSKTSALQLNFRLPATTAAAVRAKVAREGLNIQGVAWVLSRAWVDNDITDEQVQHYASAHRTGDPEKSQLPLRAPTSADLEALAARVAAAPFSRQFMVSALVHAWLADDITTARLRELATAQGTPLPEPATPDDSATSLHYRLPAATADRLKVAVAAEGLSHQFLASTLVLAWLEGSITTAQVRQLAERLDTAD